MHKGPGCEDHQKQERWGPSRESARRNLKSEIHRLYPDEPRHPSVPQIFILHGEACMFVKAMWREHGMLKRGAARYINSRAPS
jgi:hypothetical protein